jgi:hypothetical protein
MFYLWIIENMKDDVHVVDERFVSDCISFRGVLDPTQPCYRVQGAPLLVAKHPNALNVEADQTPLISPELKARRGISTPSPEPLEDEGCSQLAQSSVANNGNYGTTVAGNTQNTDQLSTAIEDAKFSEHLVSFASLLRGLF